LNFKGRRFPWSVVEKDMQTSCAPIEPPSHRRLTAPLQQPVPLLVNVQCGPAHVSRQQLVDFLRTQKRINPGFRVIDVGGSASPYPSDLITAILDIQKPKSDFKNVVWYPGNIDSPEGWREVEIAVMASGPFDFAICSHTLEDVCNPLMICEKLSRIARMGHIAVPSKYKELSRFETSPPSYRGYIHHRWIFSVRDDQFWGYPKLNFLDYDPYFDRFGGPEPTPNEQLSFWWKNAIELHIVNGGYLGPSPSHVMEYYRKGLTDDDLDRRHPRTSAPMIATPTGATSTDSATRAGFQTETPRLEAEAFFGRHLSVMERCVKAGGSELGVGVSLFALAVSINAQRIIEIGRFKGFTTFCLASALKFLDRERQIPVEHRQRPDIDYADFEGPKRRLLVSIDPCPTQEAGDLIASEGLSDYVARVDRGSQEVCIDGQADLLFIDGDHSYAGCKQDVEKYVSHNLRPGGYFVLHDYFGWYDAQQRNQSPIKAVIDELAASGRYEHLLIDTGYMSFTVFRKPSIDG
jgi:predicted O-methyltransferase YrrM